MSVFTYPPVRHFTHFHGVYDTEVCRGYHRSGLAPFMSIEEYVRHTTQQLSALSSRPSASAAVVAAATAPRTRIFRPFPISVYTRPGKCARRRIVVDPNSRLWLQQLLYDLAAAGDQAVSSGTVRVTATLNGKQLDTNMLQLLRDSPAYALNVNFDRTGGVLVPSSAPAAEERAAFERAQQEAAAVAAAAEAATTQAASAAKANDMGMPMLNVAQRVCAEVGERLAKATLSTGADRRLIADPITVYAYAYDALNNKAHYATEANTDPATFWSAHGADCATRFMGDAARSIADSMRAMPEHIDATVSEQDIADTYRQTAIQAGIFERWCSDLRSFVGIDDCDRTYRMRSDYGLVLPRRASVAAHQVVVCPSVCPPRVLALFRRAPLPCVDPRFEASGIYQTGNKAPCVAKPQLTRHARWCAKSERRECMVRRFNTDRCALRSSTPCATDSLGFVRASLGAAAAAVGEPIASGIFVQTVSMPDMTGAVSDNTNNNVAATSSLIAETLQAVSDMQQKMTTTPAVAAVKGPYSSMPDAEPIPVASPINSQPSPMSLIDTHDVHARGNALAKCIMSALAPSIGNDVSVVVVPEVSSKICDPIMEHVGRLQPQARANIANKYALTLSAQQVQALIDPPTGAVGAAMETRCDTKSGTAKWTLGRNDNGSLYFVSGSINSRKEPVTVSRLASNPAVLLLRANMMHTDAR